MKSFIFVFFCFCSVAFASNIEIDGSISAAGNQGIAIPYKPADGVKTTGLFQAYNEQFPAAITGIANNAGFGIGVMGIAATIGVYGESPSPGGFSFFGRGNAYVSGSVTADKFIGDATSVAGHSSNIVTFESAESGAVCEVGGYLTLKTIDGKSARIPFCK